MLVPRGQCAVDEVVARRRRRPRRRSDPVRVVGNVQSRRGLPGVAHGGGPVLVGEPRQDELARKRRRHRVEEADGAAGVRVAEVRGRARRRRAGRAARPRLPVQPSDATACSNSSAMSPTAATRSLIEHRDWRVFRKVRQVSEGLRHVLAADEEGRTGQLLVARGPERERGRDLDAAGRRVGRPERARRAWPVRMRPWVAAPIVPGNRRGAHSPATAAAGRSATSRSKRASHSG